MWGKKITLFLIAYVLFGGNSFGQKYIKPIDKKYIHSRYIDETGEELLRVIVPGNPPPSGFKARKAVAVSSSAVIINDVPALSWCFGCTPTTGAMLAGFYDRQGYVNMYAGPTSNGVFPINNSVWGNAYINGETRALCPLSATRNGLDGRTSRGHVDDYWIKYLNANPDPYITNGWAQHAYEDCTADFMKTSQSAYGNQDGWTIFNYYPSGSKYYGTDDEDGPYGLQLFFESRGYTLGERYSQTIVGYNGNANGFSFSNYVAEIDAGRPVMLHVEGHTMLGVGYDFDTQTVYLHDTWDYDLHSMIWGGIYDDMQHLAVSVFAIGTEGFVDENLYITNTTFSSPDECLDAMQHIYVASDGNSVNIENGASVDIIAGQSIQFMPGFHAQNGSTLSARITQSQEFCVPQGYSSSSEKMSSENTRQITGEDELQFASDTHLVKVYPNPNNGLFTVTFDNFDNETKVFVYNTFGQKVYQASTWEKFTVVELQHVRRGIYFVKAVNNQQHYEQKIIVQ
ncbi:MAG: T9SS type A sorting domain-containing protein [Bacteroidales bacterium]|nr:T9SS type A sorting domain-containing protein [Bacteroidales bacterium]